MTLFTGRILLTIASIACWQVVQWLNVRAVLHTQILLLADGCGISFVAASSKFFRPWSARSLILLLVLVSASDSLLEIVTSSSIWLWVALVTRARCEAGVLPRINVRKSSCAGLQLIPYSPLKDLYHT